MSPASDQPKSPRSGRTSAKRRAWGSLSREEILRVARRVIERDGIGELSLTSLGKQLGAGPTSMYWYFESMDELLAAVVDDVTEEMYLRLAPLGEGPWETEIIDYHLAFRRLLQRTPVYLEVFCYQSQTLFLQSRMAPFIMDQLERGVALFLRAGLTPEQAVGAHNAFSTYTRSFVLIEDAARRGVTDPHAVELLALAVARINPNFSPGGAIDALEILTLDESRYRLGLQLLVDGIRVRYLTSPAKTTKATKAARARARQSARKTNGARR
jgi:AcrR family transcriptional regulator